MPTPTMRRRQARPARRRASLLLLALFTGAIGAPSSGGCSPDPTSPEEALGVAPTLPEATGEPVSLQGAWWALSRDSPYCALRMELRATDDPDAWTGSWISFHWRGSDHVDALSSPSLPVAIAARIERQEVVITGPAPQFDQSGTPNGDRGLWDLRVRLVSPPGKPPVYAGIMVHGDCTGPRGVAVKLTRTFETWPK